MKKILFLLVFVLAFCIIAEDETKMLKAQSNKSFPIFVNRKKAKIDVVTGATQRNDYISNHEKTKIISAAATFKISGVSIRDDQVAFISTEIGEADAHDPYQGIALTKKGVATLIKASGIKSLIPSQVIYTLSTPFRDVKNKLSKTEHGMEMFNFLMNATVTPAKKKYVYITLGRSTNQSVDRFRIKTFKVVSISKVASKIKELMTEKTTEVAESTPKASDEFATLEKETPIVTNMEATTNFINTVLKATSEVASKSGTEFKLTEIDPKSNKMIAAQLYLLDLNKKFHYRHISLEEREALKDEL